MDKDFIYTKLARLVCYILETGAWKYQYFWSYNNIIYTFTHKFRVNSKTVLSYVKHALEKLIGKEYTEKQRELGDHIKRDDKFTDIFLKTNYYESFNEISIEPRDKEYARAFRNHYHLTRGELSRTRYLLIKKHYKETGEWMDLNEVEKIVTVNRRNIKHELPNLNSKE
jgi:DNA-binding CsgD family transcriptional regulator